MVWNQATTDYQFLKRPDASVRIRTVQSGYIIGMIAYGTAALLATVIPPVSLLIGAFMIVYLARLKYHSRQVV